MTKIKCIFDKEEFSKKPNDYEAGIITNRMTINKAQEYSIEYIKETILKGQTIRPACCDKNEYSWQSQQLFMIDIDNKPKRPKKITKAEYEQLCKDYILNHHRTYNDIINHCIQLNLLPNFIYTSFNHQESHHKMRLVYVLDENITDVTIAKNIQLALMSLIGDVDEQCKNLNRFFYGGKSIVYESNNIINKNNILNHINLINNNNNLNLSEGVLGGYNIMINNTNTILSPQNPLPNKKYNISALRERDVLYLINKLKYPEKHCETESEFFDYIKKEINLRQLLEINSPASFRCILHSDSNNSANIFQNEEGIYFYKCFSSNCDYSDKALTIVTLIEALAGFKSRYKTYEFIKKIFNITFVESQFQKEQKENIASIYTAMNSADSEFEGLCPQSNKNIRHVKELFFTLLEIAKQHIYDVEYTDKDGNIIFFASLYYIGKMMKFKTIDKLKISQRLSVLIYHKLINKLDDNQIPERLLKKSQGYAIHSNDGFGTEKRINWYSIPSFVISQYQCIEEQGYKWNKFGYTIKGSSREMFFRTEGKEVADWIYPQHKYIIDASTGEIVDRTTSSESDQKTFIIEQNMMALINSNQYCSEKQVLQLFREEYKCGEDTAKIQFKKSQAQLISKNNLLRIRLNKELKSKYNVSGEGYPFIYVLNAEQ